MGQALKIRHCVLKIKVNTNLIVRTGPNKHISFYSLNFTTTAVPVIQSPSSKSSPFKSKSKSESSPFKSKSKSKSLAFESKSSPSPQEIGLESDLSPSPGQIVYKKNSTKINRYFAYIVLESAFFAVIKFREILH